MFKVRIISFVMVLLVGVMYFMVEYRTFGGPQIALAVNTDFSHLEDFFQEEPEQPAPIASTTAPLAVKVPIIIYHSVRPYIPGESIIQDRYDITPELFEQQLVYLREHGYTPISFDALAQDIKMGTTTPAMKPVVLTFDDGWENQYTYALPILLRYHMVATFYVYTNPIDAKRPHYLSWDQLREMSAEGMTIGSHTLSHPFLKDSSYSDMRREIFESKKRIETELKKPILNFAQPFGYTNPEIESLIKEAGYVTARGTIKGEYHSLEDIFHLQGYFTSDNFSDFVTILNK